MAAISVSWDVTAIPGVCTAHFTTSATSAFAMYHFKFNNVWIESNDSVLNFLRSKRVTRTHQVIQTAYEDVTMNRSFLTVASFQRRMNVHQKW